MGRQFPTVHRKFEYTPKRTAGLCFCLTGTGCGSQAVTYDPLCGWCYAASPLIDVIANAGIPMVLHGGGLWQSPTHLSADKRSYIRRSDARIAEVSGVTFGAAYSNDLLSDPDTVFWSRPTIQAVLAAGALKSGADRQMLHAIQQAHYVDGRCVTDVTVITALAGQIGLGTREFIQHFENVKVDEHISDTRQLMQRTGISGFPGFLLERDHRLLRVAHEPFYGHPAKFLSAVLSLDMGREADIR